MILVMPPLLLGLKIKQALAAQNQARQSRIIQRRNQQKVQPELPQE